MAKFGSEYTHRIDFQVTGGGILADTIRSIGESIKKIDFDKLSEIAGVAALLQGLEDNTFKFDVSTGTGIEESIRKMGEMLHQINQVKELREEFEKFGGLPQAETFAQISQSAVQIPEGMTRHYIQLKRDELRRRDYFGMDFEEAKKYITELEELDKVLTEAQTFLRKHKDGRFLDADARKFVETFTNFDAILRDAIGTNYEEMFENVRGLIGNSVSTLFQSMSQATRDTLIRETEKEINRRREDLKELNAKFKEMSGDKTVSKSEITMMATEIAELNQSIVNLVARKKEYTDASKMMKEIERDATSLLSQFKTYQSAWVKAQIAEHSQDFQKLFEEIPFVDNKTSAQLIIQQIELREKQIFDMIQQSPRYAMTADEISKFTEDLMRLHQQVLLYREIALRPKVAIPHEEFRALSAGRDIHRVSDSFTPQKLTELRRRIEDSTFESEELDGLLDTLTTLQGLAKKLLPGSRIIIEDSETQALADYILTYKNITSQIRSAIARAKSQVIKEATEAPLIGEEAYRQKEEFRRMYQGITQEGYSKALFLLKDEEGRIGKDLASAKKELTGINEEEDRATISRIKGLTAELQIIKLRTEGLREARREASISEETEERRRKIAEKTAQIKRAASERERRERELEEETEEEKQDKLDTLKTRYLERIAELEQKITMAQGEKHRLEDVLIAKKEVTIELAKIEEELARRKLGLQDESIEHAKEEIDLSHLNAEEQKIYKEVLADIHKSIEIYQEQINEEKRHAMEMDREANEDIIRSSEEIIELELERLEILNQDFDIKERAKTPQEELSAMSKEELKDQQAKLKVMNAQLTAIERNHKAHKQSLREIIAENFSLERLTRRISFIWTSMFTRQTIHKIQSLFREGFQEAQEVEKTLTRISALLDSPSTTFMSKLKEDMREVSVEYAKSFSDVGKSVSTVLTAGLSDEVAKAIAEEAAKLSAVTGASMESVSKIMTDSMIAYRGGLHEIAQLTDRLYTISRHGRVGLEELSGSFSKVATTGASVGATFEDVITAITMMTRGGAKADEAISAVDRMLMNFAKGGSKQARQSARELGIEMNTVALRNEGLVSILDKLSKATDTQAVNIAGSASAVRALSRAIAESGDYMTLYEEILSSSGATQEAFNEVSQTSAFIFEQQKQEMLAVFTAIAEDIMPVLLSAQKVLVNFINILGGKAVARTVIFGSAIFVLLNNLNKFIIATRNNIKAQEASKKATDAMTAAQIRQKAATDALKSSLMTLWPAMASMIIGFAISKIMDWTKSAKEAREEAEKLILTETEMGKRARENASSKLERIHILQQNIKTLKRYGKEVMDTSKSEGERNRALEHYNRLSQNMVNSAPALFGFLRGNIGNVNSLANQWQNVAQGLNNASVELDQYQKLTLAESTVDVARTAYSTARVSIEGLEMDIEDIGERYAKHIEKTRKLQPHQARAVLPYVEQAMRDEAEIRAGISKKTQRQVIQELERGFRAKSVLLPEEVAGGSMADLWSFVGNAGKFLKEYRDKYNNLIIQEKNFERASASFDKASEEFHELAKEDSGITKRFQYFGLGDIYDAGRVVEAGERGRRPSIDTFITAMRLEWERGIVTDLEGEEVAKRTVTEFEKGIESVKEQEREMEKHLMDKFNALMAKEEFELTQEQKAKYHEEFIAWLWRWKKEKYTRYVRVLARELEDEAITPERNKEIMDEIEYVQEEYLLGLTQFVDYDHRETGQGFLGKVSNLLYDANKKMIYQVDNLHEWMEKTIEIRREEIPEEEREEIIEAVKGVRRARGYATKALNQLYATLAMWGGEEGGLEGEELEAFILDIIGEEVAESIAGDRGLLEYLKDESIKWMSKEEQYEDMEEDLKKFGDVLIKTAQGGIKVIESAGLDIPEELKTAIVTMASGQHLVELEDFISLFSRVTNLTEEWMKNFTAGWKDVRINIVREFIREATLDMFKTEKEIEELTAEEIQQLLERELEDDVSKVLTHILNEMEGRIALYDSFIDLRILEMEQRIAERHKKIRDNIESGNIFRGFAGIFQVALPFIDEITDIKYADIRKEEYEADKERLLHFDKELKDDEKIEIKRRIAEYEVEENERMIADVEALVSSMKETWSMYYDWQMQKIQEWYNEQTRIIDNKTRFEFRSALWAEKQKEKLDKEREKREKKLAYVEKGIAVTTAIINTALAVSRTYKDFPAPYNLIMAGLMSALGGAQVALISQQKFESGGYVVGKRHSEGGVPIEVEGGEYVINRQATAKYRDILEHINEYGKSGRTQDAYIFEQGGAVSNVESSTRYINDPATTGILASIATAIKRLDIQVQVNAKTITDIELWKKTVKGQRLAKVM